MTTPFHVRYFAEELTKRCPSDSVEKLANDQASRDVDKQKDALLDEISGRLAQNIEQTELFTLRWHLT